MEKAVVISVICIFAFFGAEKFAEMLQSYFTLHKKGNAVLLYKFNGDEKDAEMVIRSLAADAEKICVNSKTVVLVIDDRHDESTSEIIRKTAEQFHNVFVGTVADAGFLLEAAVK